MKTLFVALLVTHLSFSSSVIQAAVYQWVDDKGVIHFTDNSDKIPARYRDRVQERESVKGAVTVVPSAVAPSESPSDRAGRGGTKLDVREEREWRGRFSNLREERARIESGLAAKREKLSALRRKRAIYQRGSDRIAYNEQNAEIERDEARLKELDQRLQALETEAASSGVPMEWRQ